MSDIFDEVDDILNDSDSISSEIDDSDSASKNFNESELQDIMAEIENLEKEFETDSEIDAEIEVAPVAVASIKKQTDLQSEIDRELEMSLASDDNFDTKIEEIHDEVEAPKILAFDKKPVAVVEAAPEKNSNSEISFEAHGQMNLNLAFKIGNESARLVIDPIKGLMITMSGVELCINQDDGCKVTMDSGVKFTIPLTSSESNLKKKSA
ncbi:MAG: hypothetical protein Q7U04_02725 [Bacteriovorax sp.]|nr:hypothetical protein [Bacteriovorax sp.]